jgi:hypothetical protein
MKFYSKILSTEISQNLFFYLIIGLLVATVYVPNFTGTFILDDNPLIKNNSFLKAEKTLGSYFVQEDGITGDRKLPHTGYYRPLINLTYWLDYKLWGMNAPGFRITNLILHLISAFILFHTIILLLNDRGAAFWATILFALHPVNTESVSFIAARNNILATLFVLTSLYFYITSWEKGSYCALFISLISFVGAVFSKEFGLMAPPLFFLYQRTLSARKESFLKEAGTYAPYVLVVIIYFLLRKYVTHSLLTPFELKDLWPKIYYVPYIIAWNLKLIFFPSGLHSFIVNYPPHFFEWKPFLAIIAFFFLGIIVWMKRRNRLVVFSALSFMVAILPVLNVIPTTAVTLVSMRWMYLPMIFITIGAAWIFHKSAAKKQVLTVLIMCIAIAYCGMYSYVLNKNLWHDEETFFYQEVSNFNNYFYAGGLAELLYEKKRYAEAEKYFHIAIDKDPYEARNYIVYSTLLINSGRMDDALFYLNKTRPLKMLPKDKGEWLNNMGVVLTDRGSYEEANGYFSEAVKINPEYAEAFNNMGVASARQGKRTEAISHFRKAIEIKQDYKDAGNNLKVILGQKK